jgi:hypothetical protein
MMFLLLLGLETSDFNSLNGSGTTAVVTLFDLYLGLSSSLVWRMHIFDRIYNQF